MELWTFQEMAQLIVPHHSPDPPRQREILTTAPSTCSTFPLMMTAYAVRCQHKSFACGSKLNLPARGPRLREIESSAQQCTAKHMTEPRFPLMFPQPELSSQPVQCCPDLILRAHRWSGGLSCRKTNLQVVI